MKSYHTLSMLLLTFAVLFSHQATTAQMRGNTVDVTIMLSPPHSPRLFDYMIYENKPVLTLRNNTGDTQNIMLTGSLEGDNAVSIITQKNYQPVRPIRLAPYEMRTLMATSHNLDFISENNVSINATREIRNSILRDGILPEGNYTFCIEALDFQTRQGLSPGPPAGCTMLSIGYLQPPAVITPPDQGQVTTAFPQIIWSPVVGNTGGVPVSYDLYILKLAEHQNPFDAMRQAVNYNIGNPLKKTGLSATNYLYSPSDWELEENATYALKVIAYDDTDQLYFINNGESEVTTFTYVPLEDIVDEPEEDVEPAIVSMTDFPCDCTTDLPSGPPRTNFTVNPSDEFQLGSYVLTVRSISEQPGNDGRFSGEGTIPFPLGSGTVIPVEMVFSELVVNNENEALAGFAVAKVDENAHFIPDTAEDETTMPFTHSEATGLANYFFTHPGQRVSNPQGETFRLPLGIDRSINGQEQIIAVTGMYVTPEKASVDAAAAVEMPDVAPSVIAFGRKYICLHGNGLCHTPEVIFLPGDISLQFLTGEATMTLLGVRDLITVPADSGSYVAFDQQGFQKMRIQADYTFPSSHLVTKNDAEVTARVTASTTAWNDWTGDISINEEFGITGVPDLTFGPVQGMYDHSDLRNPEDLPSSYIESHSDAALPDWKGIIFPQVEVQLPGVIKKLHSHDRLSATVEALVMDDLGASLYLLENDLMSLSEGDLDGWAYSVETFQLNIFRNAILEGSFEGKLLLPIAPAEDNESSQLGYSCLMSMENEAFQYQFSVDSTLSAPLPMWRADMTLEPTSTIMVDVSEDALTATASLNGKMNISGNVGQLKRLKLENMEFEELGLSSQTNAITIGTMSAGEDGDKKLAGFPISVDAVHPDTLTGLGFSVSTSIALSDIQAIPEAKTAFSITGKEETAADRTHYVFNNAVIDSIQLEGDLSVVKIKGVMVFFNDDPTFGDGFKGTVEAEFPNIVEIKSTIQFGDMGTDDDSFKYWYVDAMADLKSGFPLFPPYVYGYGFGGGAYYRMERTLPADYDSTITTKDPSENTETGAAPSGVQYLPNKDVRFGLKAMLLFGLQERNTFNADVTMELDINNNGGLNNFFLYGEARVLSKDESGEDQKKAMVKGGIDVRYDVSNEIFHADMNGELNFAVVKATIPTQLHFEPAGWYVHMGRPRPHTGVELTILDRFKILSYFQAGTMDIDPIPPIPDKVLNILTQSGIDHSFFGYRDNMVITSGKGMICGADMTFDYSGRFLIFSGSLDAQAGYDLSIKKYTTDCDGIETDDPVGVNGWYAYGQMYAGIEALISMHIDLKFYNATVKILEAGAGAALLGGVPNPTWVKGAVGGHFSVLSGRIEGRFNFKFSHGQECVPSPEDVLEGLEIIAEIFPDDGAEEIEITILPAVATNLRITDYPFTLDEVNHDTGEVTQRVFRLAHDNLHIELRNTSNDQMVESERLNSSEEFGVFIKPVTVLQPETEFQITITATVDEYVNHTWQRAEMRDGTPFEEVHELTFTTDSGLQYLDENSVMYTMPYQRQRSFFYLDVAQGGIFTTQNINFEHFDIPGPDDGYDQQFVARFVPVGSAEGSGAELPVTDGFHSFTFDWPNLQSETVYAVQFIGRWTRPATEPLLPARIFEEREFQLFNQEDSRVTQTQRVINMEKLQLAENEKELYTIFFRTSRYDGYQAKLHDVETNELVLSTEFSQSYTNDPSIGTYLYLESEELNDLQMMISTIRQQLHLTSDDHIDILAPHQVCMTGEEPFEHFDVYGFSKSYQQGDMTYSYDGPALISIEVDGVNEWAWNLFGEMVDLLGSSEGVTRFQLPGYSDVLGGYLFETPELDIPAAPPLSDSEIYDGTVLLFYPGALQSVCSQTKLDSPIPQQPVSNSQNGMTFINSGGYIPVAGGGYHRNIIGDQFQQVGFDRIDFGLGDTQRDIAESLSRDKNLINITYQWLYKPGRGVEQGPNDFLNRAMGYTDPSPEVFGSFYSTVGQAFDTIQNEFGNVAATDLGVSATFTGPAASAVTTGQMNAPLGTMNMGNL